MLLLITPGIVEAGPTFVFSVDDTSKIQFVQTDSIIVHTVKGDVVRTMSQVIKDSTLDATQPQQILLIKRIPMRAGRYIITSTAAHRYKVLEFVVDKKKQVSILSSLPFGEFVIDKPAQIIFKAN